LQKLTQTRQKALGKAFKLADDKGLYLFITPQAAGWGKCWRLKYRIDGKEKLLAFGTYPEISLEQARQRREDARKLLACQTALKSFH